MHRLFAVLILRLVVSSLAGGSYSIPDSCEDNCTFKVSWSRQNGQVEFSVLARVEKGDWAGIGFSKDRKMEGSDAVVAWMTMTDSLVVTDRFLFAKSPNAVAVDATNNLAVKGFSHSDGVLTFTFSRNIVTGDTEDIPLDEPFYLLVAWGGQGSDDEASITKHTSRQIFSTMVSLDETEAPNTSTKTMPTRSIPLTTIAMPTLPTLTPGMSEATDGAMATKSSTSSSSIKPTPETVSRSNKDTTETIFTKQYTESAATNMPTESASLASTRVTSSQTPQVTPSSRDKKPTISTRPAANPVSMTADAESRGINETIKNGGDTDEQDQEIIKQILRTITDAQEESVVPSKSTNSVILTSTLVTSSRTTKVTPSSSDAKPTISTSTRSTTNPVTTISDAGSRGLNQPSNGGDTGELDEETIQEILRTITDVPEGPLGDRMIPEIQEPNTTAAVTPRSTTQPATAFTTSTQSIKLVLVKTCEELTCPKNSHCVVQHQIARCYCDDSFALDKNGNCVRRAGASKPTMNKCAVKKCPQHSSCKDGVCYCHSGYVMSSSKCIASSKMRDSCTGVICPPNSECKNGFCICRSGAAYKNGRCQVSETGNDKCKGVKCPDNSQCRNGYCFCNQGYFNYKGGCRKRSGSSDPCEGVYCSQNAICAKGRCICKQGYTWDEMGKCKGIAGEINICDQVTCPQNANCYQGRCRCNLGFTRRKDGRGCEVVQDKCSGVKCQENASCKEGRCLCNQGHIKHGDGKCVVPPEDKCATVRCIANAECKKGFCFCNPGYVYDDHKCKAKDPCRGVRCSSNALCVNGKCVCKTGYYAKHTYGQCQKVVVNKCARVQCPENSVCKDGRCDCKTGYFRHTNGMCTVVPTASPDKCQEVHCPANSACKNGLCFCRKGYSQKHGQCIATNQPKLCANVRCPDNAECRVSRCYCKIGYIASSGKCIKITSNTCTPLNCGTHGTCVMRNGLAGCAFSSSRPQYAHPPVSRPSCRNKCGAYDYERRCFCRSTCVSLGMCCRDFQYHCVNRFYNFHG